MAEARLSEQVRQLLVGRTGVGAGAEEALHLGRRRLAKGVAVELLNPFVVLHHRRGAVLFCC